MRARVWGRSGGRGAAAAERVGATPFELGDHLGSTSVVLDQATGELVERASFYAYGATESDYRPDRWAGFREDYRFTGKEEDVEVGLTYFGKRYLSPYLGRWVSPDPLAVHVPGDADWNLYAYVHGRLLQATDPVGLEDTSEPMSSEPVAAIASMEDGSTQMSDGSVVRSTPAPPPEYVSPGPAAPKGVNPFLNIEEPGLDPVDLDQVQVAADVVGLLPPPLGLAGDVVSTGISLKKGEYIAASVGVAAMVGLDALKALKYADEAGDALSAADDVAGLGDGVFKGPKSLREMAREISHSADAPQARRRTIAVASDADGVLWVGSSNGLDRGMREAVEELGINRVKGSAALHAEEELIRHADDAKSAPLTAVGTWSSAPCAAAGHMCAAKMTERSIVSVGGSGYFPGSR